MRTDEEIAVTTAISSLSWLQCHLDKASSAETWPRSQQYKYVTRDIAYAIL